ncbi:2961_t:CDS:2 [Funneliformis mosseae]|uniref:2961_t:CDS:1 n=1 Tax=Funneliformis mosseae TaxID=27381 RepID=A0A9N9DLY1_FUNMO|nr:2961_t:CDS:2 [Funneliformis mosseae]
MKQNIIQVDKIEVADTICNDNTIQEPTVVKEDSDEGLDEGVNI